MPTRKVNLLDEKGEATRQAEAPSELLSLAAPSEPRPPKSQLGQILFPHSAPEVVGSNNQQTGYRFPVHLTIPGERV
jgi:hypothetical protein